MRLNLYYNLHWIPNPCLNRSPATLEICIFTWTCLLGFLLLLSRLLRLLLLRCPCPTPYRSDSDQSVASHNSNDSTASASLPPLTPVQIHQWHSCCPHLHPLPRALYPQSQAHVPSHHKGLYSNVPKRPYLITLSRTVYYPLIIYCMLSSTITWEQRLSLIGTISPGPGRD